MLFSEKEKYEMPEADIQYIKRLPITVDSGLQEGADTDDGEGWGDLM